MRALARKSGGHPAGRLDHSQQLAKLYLRRTARGILDKLSEALFATWLVRQAGPDEVAGLY